MKGDFDKEFFLTSKFFEVEKVEEESLSLKYATFCQTFGFLYKEFGEI